ncbi:VOC family protein [Rathayibacter sp. KR2-224]|uniref:VOC family protein n=1 Tax=Rathayibacter sp. KR2-224 TaxID=3400913 RepID=UPI003BFC26DF
MASFRLDHVGVVVRDLERVVDFFVALGFTREGSSEVSGEWVDRIIGLGDVRSEVVFLRPPGGGAALELSAFRSPEAIGEEDLPSNTVGYRHLSYEVDDLDAVVANSRAAGYDLVGELVDYEDVYRLGYLRGPEGLLVEVAQSLRS